MQAILQGKHNRLCSLIKENNLYPERNTADITKLENELLTLYDTYKMRMGDLREVIELYLKVEKSILVRLKEHRRQIKDGKEIIARQNLLSGNLKLNS